jgi:hypothetical protein
VITVDRPQNEGARVKKFLLAVAVAAVAILGIVSSASADVLRYQEQSMTITAVQPKDEYGQWNDVWTHTYKVTLNPCDNSFTGTGEAVGTGYPGVYTNETITGHFDGTTLSYKATYTGPSSIGVKYALDGPISATLNATAWDAADNVIDTYPNVLEFHVSATNPIASTNYRNHGAYVSQTGGSDAAHSCIGMPIS